MSIRYLLVVTEMKVEEYTKLTLNEGEKGRVIELSKDEAIQLRDYLNKKYPPPGFLMKLLTSLLVREK